MSKLSKIKMSSGLLSRLSPAKGVFCKIFSICGVFQQTRAHKLVKMTSASKWKAEKNRILGLPLEERRNIYSCKDYITLDSVDPWDRYVVKNPSIETKKHTLDDLNQFKKIILKKEMNKELAEKVSIYKGDITKLEVDAIVNAANSRLIAGGGVDGAIHRVAGPFLQQECNSLGGCPTGEAKITCGYNLPAKYVIHTVGPQDGNAEKLKSCYDKSLAFHNSQVTNTSPKLPEYHIRSIAFPCISTGIYGFPNRLAAHIALKTVREFLEFHKEMDRIIFCTFMPIDIDIYETLMQMYFPLHEWNYEDGASLTK